MSYVPCRVAELDEASRPRQSRGQTGTFGPEHFRATFLVQSRPEKFATTGLFCLCEVRRHVESPRFGPPSSGKNGQCGSGEYQCANERGHRIARQSEDGCSVPIGECQRSARFYGDAPYAEFSFGGQKRGYMVFVSDDAPPVVRIASTRAAPSSNPARILSRSSEKWPRSTA